MKCNEKIILVYILSVYAEIIQLIKQREQKIIIIIIVLSYLSSPPNAMGKQLGDVGIHFHCDKTMSNEGDEYKCTLALILELNDTTRSI